MLGTELPTLKASPIGPVVSAATITALRTKPSAREASEPRAMIRPLRPAEAGAEAGAAACSSDGRGAEAGAAAGAFGGCRGCGGICRNDMVGGSPYEPSSYEP